MATGLERVCLALACDVTTQRGQYKGRGIDSERLCRILTFSRLFDLLSSRNDFCSGLGGPRCGVSSRNATTRSSAALGTMPGFSFGSIELRLLFTLLAGVGDAGIAPVLAMPLGAVM